MQCETAEVNKTPLVQIKENKMYKKIVEYGWYIIDRLFSKFRKPMRCGYQMEYEKYKDLIEREIK